MTTAKQIAWRKKFGKLYGGKKKKRKKSRRADELSEEKFVKRLQRLEDKILAFRTGKAVGVPDIVAFSRGRISFYEIKPASTSIYDYKSSFLKNTQENWIKKNCLENKIKAYIVFYLRFGQKGTKYKYHQKRLTVKNLKKYSQSSSKSSRISTVEKAERDFYAGRINFT